MKLLILWQNGSATFSTGESLEEILDDIDSIEANPCGALAVGFEDSDECRFTIDKAGKDTVLTLWDVSSHDVREIMDDGSLGELSAKADKEYFGKHGRWRLR